MQRTRCAYFYDIATPCNKREPHSGCGAFAGHNRMNAILGMSDACIAVHPDYQRSGFGATLLAALEQRARTAGMDSVFVLTTRTMHWFIKRGFQVVDPDWLPEARKRKYNWDRRSQVLVKKL